MDHYLLYLFIATLTVASPGPGVLLTLSNSIRHDLKTTLASILGISLGIFIIAVISASSLGLILATSAIAFSILKFVGAAYLIYLGVKLWRSPAVPISQEGSRKESMVRSVNPNYAIRFKEGLLVSVLNPKAIFFFMSLFPQFIHQEQSYLHQFSVLTITFCALIIIVHTIYALSANLVRAWLSSPKGINIVKRLGGGVFVLFGFALAGSER